ncbi:hypothetical protein [Vibrio vulnificus YJ016]|uniref:Uncharacterized protein n=1 Tax=Vibrio vulnificus (strain YJ016) TaxID=196600 RepID=Q7MEC7_VIBVY|nr:hypothetical protein [Vibrio vulnificus YJ016]
MERLDGYSGGGWVDRNLVNTCLSRAAKWCVSRLRNKERFCAPFFCQDNVKITQTCAWH